MHKLSKTGTLEHVSFLDLSGEDPSKAFAQSVATACGDGGPVYVYNQKFEAGILKGLADKFSELKHPLMAIIERMVDLLPIAEEHYYHHDQRGSWSIKAVLPTVAPDLDYQNLEGVRDGGMAMEAYAEAIRPDTVPDRNQVLHRQLLDYCKRDTYAMVRLWQHFL